MIYSEFRSPMKCDSLHSNTSLLFYSLLSHCIKLSVKTEKTEAFVDWIDKEEIS